VDPVEAIRRAQAANLVDEDGHEVVLELHPGLTRDEIQSLEDAAGVPLPRELRMLLAHTAGLDGALETVDFTGRTLDFEDLDIFPAGLPIAHDGFGNHWVVDLTPDETETATVFFACHDPPVVLYQSPTLGRFLHEAFRLSMPPHESLVDDVHEDRLFHVWRDDPGVLDRPAALAGDEDLHAFADALDDRFVFVDLRSPEPGMGFSWGRYGPRTEVRRHGYVRLFAYARPERKPGLLTRLFGRDPGSPS
jgi:cell wall assembly regulator SMI1